MSLHFDIVIVCDLREDTPSDCLELLAWLTDANSSSEARPRFHCFDENYMELADAFDHPFLAPLPNEEVISVFQRRYRYTMPTKTGGKDVYRYCLQFSARGILDDYFYECHLLFTYWLASVSEDGFIGYYKEELDNDPILLYVKDRKLVS
ncbi:MAG: hypothetical protein R3E39_20545 [Anaerolineae bacterium]